MRMIRLTMIIIIKLYPRIYLPYNLIKSIINLYVKSMKNWLSYFVVSAHNHYASSAFKVTIIMKIHLMSLNPFGKMQN